MAERKIVAVTQDPVVLRGLRRAAAALGASLSLHGTLAVDVEEMPAALVVDVEQPEAVEAARRWKAAWPQALLAGYVSSPSRAPWEQAEAAGFDLVASRGALGTQLEHKLKTWGGAAPVRRVHACDAADLAGRLGRVARLAEPNGRGEVAVYHVRGQVYAVQDECPHAGARLSEGALEDTVVTCPLHGSQFDVRTGERLRGPADEALQAYPVEIDGAQVYIQFNAPRVARG